MAVGIGESEVDEFEMLPITCQHHIRGLEVAMLCLSAVHIGNSLEEHIGNVQTLAEGGVLLTEPLPEGDALYPFHHDAETVASHLFE